MEAQGLIIAHRGMAEWLASMGRQAEAIAGCERIAAHVTVEAGDRDSLRAPHLELTFTRNCFTG